MTARRILTEMTAELARSPWRILVPGAAASLDHAAQAAERHASLLQAAVRHWREVAEGYRIDAENNRREAEALPQFLAMRDAILHSVMDTGFFDNRHKPAIEADGFVTMDQLLNELDERAAFQAPCEEI